MDVMFLPGDSIRVKGKNSTLIINPTSATTKTEADAILLLSKIIEFSDSKIEGSRITIKGPGEYEVGGAKISAISVEGNIVARIDIDSVKVVVGDGQSMEKVQDKIEGSDLLVVNANDKFNYSNLATLEPKVILAYGALKDEVSKSLGKESAEKLNKFATTADKLPAELQFILLG